MKTKLIFLLLILTSLMLAQDSKGIFIKSKAGNEGKRWAICVGINDYDDKGILDLKKAQNDAEALGAALKDYGQFDYVYKMTDKNDPRSDEYPSLRKLRSKFKYLNGFLNPEDLVVFSFSGHGVSNKNGESYLVLSDSDPNDIYNTSLKLKEITDVLKSSGVKKSLLLVDACREVLQENKGINQNGLKAEKFEKSEVAATFYATKDGWFSYEDDKGDYGAFTKYVLKGIEGEADNYNYQGNGDGTVTFTELASFVEEGVTDWALSQGKLQRPYTQINGEKFGDLALASYKGVQLNRKSNSTSEGVSSDFIFVQGGTFNREGNNVTVRDFYIGKTEVTQAQYQAVMGKNPSSFKGENLPVETVSWNDAVEYCNKLSSTSGQIYRLPTEAEWEYAARGGNRSNGYEYSGSSNVGEIGWYYENSGNRTLYDDNWDMKNLSKYNCQTHSVAGKKPNELGIYDMSGNVWEWCGDWYDDYPSSSQTNPTGASSGSLRVLRGGGWNSYAEYCRVAYRSSGNMTRVDYIRGFRVVRLP